MKIIILTGIVLCFEIGNILGHDMNITVRKGYQARLPCYYQVHSKNPILKWNKRNGDRDTLLTSNTDVYLYIGKITVESIASNEMNLLISKTSEEFSGQYLCTTDENGNKIILVNVTLIIEKPPWIDTSSAENITIMEHADLKLDCVASGIPTPVVRWYRSKNSYRNAIFTGVTGNTLIIRNVSRFATDVYICNATNSVDSAKREISVTVNFEPEVSVMEPSVYGGSNKEVAMACVVHGTSVRKAYWIDNQGEEVKTNWKYNVSEELAGDGIPMRFLTLTVLQTTKKDCGIYTCQANGDTFIKNATVELKSSGKLLACKICQCSMTIYRRISAVL